MTLHLTQHLGRRAAIAWLLAAATAVAAESDWQPLFDGRSLGDWEASESCCCCCCGWRV